MDSDFDEFALDDMLEPDDLNNLLDTLGDDEPPIIPDEIRPLDSNVLEEVDYINLLRESQKRRRGREKCIEDLIDEGKIDYVYLQKNEALVLYN